VTLKGNMKQSAFALLQKIKDRSGKTVAAPDDEPEVRGTYPAAGVTAEELLRVAASAHRFAVEPFAPAIIRQAEASELTLSDPEDFRYLPSGGIHCWVRGVPTLAGSRDFLVKLGIQVGDTPPHAPFDLQIFVAHGTRFLGHIQIACSRRSLT
jgi:cation transport ATPase